MKIGFIGTGVMGSRMAKRLLDREFQVYIYNRSVEKAKPLLEQGALYAESISSLASQCDVICTCLSMPEDVIEVYTGPDGINENARSGTVCIDLTSVGADTSKTIFGQANAKGISYLDSPVSGGPEGAENGTLTIMVGGEKAAFEKVKPILEVLGETIEYLGQPGSGSIAKLINQYLVAVHSLAASEAMVAGAAYGLDSEQMFNILKVSYGDSRILRRHMEQYVFDRNFEPGGAVKYVHKDVRLANRLLQEAGLERFTGQMAEQAFKKAGEKGLDDLDMSAVILPLEEQARVVVKRNK
ncbi:3-hydroxyisobutyrate dehydrogenase [Cytobacillus oceanisediminis]|jgi:3-hydroxyisobutyrate dehydrogenase|uniref:3-hydroxyisobutyrate dehydrogenase n=1 Tax=Cytobacillus oceanisediminis TaxID=665099 RepID=A0A2V2ZRU2_9BACI|nr:NAD(P)-dependent oxidoreductase [Cytobacillus oceanisediminis]PWW27043.1 3-hydroxyisobutyrate dehydrogenase [Cytobacillus oceanisediminis]